MMTAEQFLRDQPWAKNAKLEYSYALSGNEIVKLLEAYAAAQLAELTAKLPETFFVGHDLAFRLERLVDGWQRAVTANLTLEAQLAEKEREIEDLQTKCRDMAVALGNQIARAEAAEQRLQEAQARWELYEREYILPQFGWAEELGIDLKELVHDNAGKNCAQLFYEALRERLRQREAELEQRWIAVGERLPEYGSCIMVYVHERADPHKQSWQDLATYSYHGGWYVGESRSKNENYEVTHWQPLPSPPTEAK